MDVVSIKLADGCRELLGASETTMVESSALSFVGRQGLTLSSMLTVGVSSIEKHGRHDAVPVVAGLLHDLADAWPPLLLGGPGVFDGGTFPNIFAVIATRRSRKLTRDDDSSSNPACAASHAAGSMMRISTVVTASLLPYPTTSEETIPRKDATRTGGWSSCTRTNAGDDPTMFRMCHGR